MTARPKRFEIPFSPPPFVLRLSLSLSFDAYRLNSTYSRTGRALAPKIKDTSRLKGQRDDAFYISINARAGTFTSKIINGARDGRVVYIYVYIPPPPLLCFHLSHTAREREGLNLIMRLLKNTTALYNSGHKRARARANALIIAGCAGAVDGSLSLTLSRRERISLVFPLRSFARSSGFIGLSLARAVFFAPAATTMSNVSEPCDVLRATKYRRKRARPGSRYSIFLRGCRREVGVI